MGKLTEEDQSRLDCALMAVCRGNDLKHIDELIQKGAQVNPENGEFSPLMLATLRGNIEVMRFLVEKHGANVNAKKADGMTALMYASGYRSHEMGGQLEKTEYLLEKGASPLVRTNEGMSARDFAKQEFKYQGDRIASALREAEIIAEKKLTTSFSEVTGRELEVVFVDKETGVKKAWNLVVNDGNQQTVDAFFKELKKPK